MTNKQKDALGEICALRFVIIGEIRAGTFLLAPVMAYKLTDAISTRVYAILAHSIGRNWTPFKRQVYEITKRAIKCVVPEADDTLAMDKFLSFEFQIEAVSQIFNQIDLAIYREVILNGPTKK